MPARILIVEDTPHNLELMRYLLETRGHTVVEATSGRAGTARAREGEVDLVILDLQLGDATGFELLHAIRLLPKLAGVPVVAVTAFAMVGDRDRVLSAGFDGYIAKPIEPQMFVEQVDSFLLERLRGNEVHPKRAPRGPKIEEASGGGTSASRVLLATILVVDDRRQNIDLARGLLEPSGYEVLCASSIEDALDMLTMQSPDLVICDIHLGSGNALDLLEHVQYDASTQTVPFLFHSATASPDDMRRIETLGAKFLARPVDPSVLLEVVREIIRASVQSGPEGP